MKEKKDKAKREGGGRLGEKRGRTKGRVGRGAGRERWFYTYSVASLEGPARSKSSGYFPSELLFARRTRRIILKK